jgi:hypothetical protein
VATLYWYNESILDNKLHSIYGTWNRFMRGIPLSQGGYQDAAVLSSNPNLEAIGQKNLATGLAHLWINNKQDTWTAAIENRVIAPVSGMLELSGFSPNTPFQLTWFDTRDIFPEQEESIQSSPEGVIQLTISGLASDIAVRIQPLP